MSKFQFLYYHKGSKWTVRSYRQGGVVGFAASATGHKTMHRASKALIVKAIKGTNPCQ